jgi:hypothetical protein
MGGRVEIVIPPFDESGWLPPGIHTATLAEIEERFGSQSEVRRAQMESLRWMVELAIRAGIRRIILNGSFATAILEPNDVDCVLLLPDGFPVNQAAEMEIRNGLPFLEIVLVNSEEFDGFVNYFFASDRLGQVKGMIEVISWN